jgi:flagellar motor switch protein FliN/FliY
MADDNTLENGNDQKDEADDFGMGDDWAAALSEEGGGAKPEAANFNDLGDGKVSTETHNLDFLLDIPLEVTVELGRTTMIINNLLQLTQGSVVELNKAAADSVEIYVNHKLLGKGEVIIVNDRFGVRITEIISQAERIKNIR